MSNENDKILAFGKWLTQKCTQCQFELNSMVLKDSCPIDAIRRKGGHLEAYQMSLGALKELYQGDLESFVKGYSLEEEKEEGENAEV